MGGFRLLGELTNMGCSGYDWALRKELVLGSIPPFTASYPQTEPWLVATNACPFHPDSLRFLFRPKLHRC